MQQRWWVWMAMAAGCGDDGGASTDAPRDRDAAIDSRPADAAVDAPPLGTCAIHAGTNAAGFMDGPGNVAQFSFPQGLGIDAAGNLYVGDLGNARVRKIAPDGTTSTLAGNGTRGFVDGTGGATGTTQFVAPAGIAVSSDGSILTSDFGGHRVRKLAADGTTTTLAGNGMLGKVDGTGGPNGTTQFAQPNAMTADADGNAYVLANNQVRKIAPDGTTTTLAGNSGFGYMDGTGGAMGTTMFAFGGENVGGLAVDPEGNVYAADFGNSRVRKIAPDGTTTTLAGNGAEASVDGTGGPDGTASILRPFHLTRAADGMLYVVEFPSSQIRKIAPDGTTTTIADTCEIGNLRGIAVRGSTLYIATGDQSTIYAMQIE